MSDENIVILARPHPFIAEDMKALLSRTGFTPMAISDLDAIKTLQPDRIKGAVISTSVGAGGEIEKTFENIRRALPEIPIVFATLLETDQAISMLKAELAACLTAPEFIPIASLSIDHPALGTANGYVIIHKDQIGDVLASKYADQIIPKHFR